MNEPDETASGTEESGPPCLPDEPCQEEAGAAPSQPPPLLIREQLRTALRSVLILTVLTGIVFPLALAVPARLLFPHQSDGSLVIRNRIVIGSQLIGQADARPGYFHPRPSAAGSGYDAASSGGTNLGPANPKLRDGTRDNPATPDADESFPGVRQLAEDFRRKNGLPAETPIPIDAVTRSGSGLDPHISPANASLQVARVARERGLSEETVGRIVGEHTFGRQLGFLGDPRVSVLELNLALDRATASLSSTSTR